MVAKAFVPRQTAFQATFAAFLLLVLVPLASARHAAGPAGSLATVQVLPPDAALAAVSPDGRNVYSAGGRSDRMHAYRRASTGTLTLLPGKAGCIARTDTRCTRGGAINGPTALVVGRSGTSVFLASWTGRQHAALFGRSRSTGALRLLSCLGEGTETVACSPGGRRTTGALAVSPDGRFGYLAQREGPKKVTIFSIGNGGQSLREVGCIGRANSTTCTRVRTLLFNPTALVVSPDGRNLYVTSSTSRDHGIIFAFARDKQTGLVTPLAGAGACLSATVSTCTPLRPLSFVDGSEGQPGGAIAISLDGRTVVVGGFPGPSTVHGIVLALGRDPGTGTLTPGGCLGEGTGCSPARKLGAVGAVALSPDGRTVYAGTFGSLVIGRLSAALSLSQLTGRYGCIVRPLAGAPQGCATLPAGASGVWSIAASRDGHSLYAAAGKLVAFRVRG